MAHGPTKCMYATAGVKYDIKTMCRVCWLALNPHGDLRLGKILSKVPGPIRSAERKAPCVHLIKDTAKSLDPLGQRTDCSKAYTWECELFERCTRGTKFANVACCQSCDRYTTEAIIQDCIELKKRDTAQWVRQAEVQEAQRVLAERALENLPPCPELSGRGIIMCGGGRYNASLYVSIRMVRQTGCRLPIQLWHHAPSEPIDNRILSLDRVSAHDTSQLVLRRLSGWPMKTLAWMNSGWSEILYFDADAYPVCDPTDWFYYNPDGCVIFGDFDSNDRYLKRDSYPFTKEALQRLPPSLNGGHYVIDVERTWRAVAMAFHFDQHDDYWHQFTSGVGGYSEQDQFRAALALTGCGWSMWPKPFKYQRGPRGGAFLHYGPNGEEAIVHRVGCKFAESGAWKKPPSRQDWLPGEDQAWTFFEQWKANPYSSPAEPDLSADGCLPDRMLEPQS